MTKATTAILVVVALLAPPLRAASTKVKPEDVGVSSERLMRVNEAVRRHIDAGGFSGAVTLVARKGRLIHLEAHGLMDLGAQKPMSTDAVFRIASMTKPVVAVAVLMMMEEGKLRLSDPVSRFVPEFKNLKVAIPLQRAGAAEAGSAAPGAPSSDTGFSAVPADREITIRDLLTHTSGLVSGGISATEAAKITRKPTDTLADYLPKLASVPLAFQPGARWAYSPGAGFDTLGRVVEVASGQPFDRFLRERLFTPLGMKDTFFYFPPPDRLSRIPSMYQRTPKGIQKVESPDVTRSSVYFGGGAEDC
jgi:CubicO group peptidase (beta-lactamase class C family)